MRPKPQKTAEECLLLFNEDYEDLEELRSEISSCLITGRNLWLSYDEGAAIERLTRTARGYGYHRHYEMSGFFDLPADDEMDMEALAYAEPYLWFCGSMSLKRDTPEPDEPLAEQISALAEISLDRNRFSLGRIPCVERDGGFELFRETEHESETLRAAMLVGGAEGSMLHNVLMHDEHLSMFMDVPCKDNGFDIEGLAVAGERIFIGLRGPVLHGFAVILEITCKAAGDDLIMESRQGEDKLYRKHFLDLAGMGIRELNIDDKGDLYLLAGPTMDLDGTISIYRVKGGLENNYASVVHEPERLFDVARGSELGHGQDKAEGMAFGDDGSILITYDSPVEERLEGDNGVRMDWYRL